MAASFRFPVRLATLCLALGAGLASCGPKEPQPPLHTAARLGRVDEVRSLLEGGAKIDEPTEKTRRTPLHIACENGRPEVVKLLLDKGADPALEDASGRTPWDALWEESRKNWLTRTERDVLIALLEGSAPLDTGKDADGKTWLHHVAGRCDSGRVIQLLVEDRGFDVNARDKNGWTPLHVAVFENRVEAAEALLQQGAEVNAETTAEIGETMPKGETYVVRFRYEAGSRPLDLYHGSSGRNKKSMRALLREYGGTSNPEVENRFFR